MFVVGHQWCCLSEERGYLRKPVRCEMIGYVRGEISIASNANFLRFTSNPAFEWRSVVGVVVKG